MVESFSFVIMMVLIFVVAALYSSVGHGGASGYLAMLSFYLPLSSAVTFGIVVQEQMSSTALVLNLLVAAVGSYSFWKAKHFSLTLTWPFLVSSVPLAFLGGLISISDKTYFLLLAAVLMFAAIRLAMPVNNVTHSVASRSPSLKQSLPIGGGIGLLSGIVGVGGGIFLSPLMILFRWADPKQTAAVSAVFIWVNSLAGLAGRFAREAFVVGNLLPLVIAALAGGLLGSHIGATKFSGLALRRLLAVVLLIASLKLLIPFVF